MDNSCFSHVMFRRLSKLVILPAHVVEDWPIVGERLFTTYAHTKDIVCGCVRWG